MSQDHRKQNGIARRDVLRGSAALGAAVMAGGAFAADAAQAAPAAKAASGLMVRKAFNTLTAKEIESLRKGVQVMKERPASDPTSWWFQANMHGTYLAANTDFAKQTWNMCPHGGYYFFPWHRMYLYWFEKILRKASGDPALTLPYWNYTNPKYLAMPSAFLTPASAANALWDQDRLPFVDSDAGINVDVGAGQPMPWSLINPQAAWSYLNFCAMDGSKNSFGSTHGAWHHLPPPSGFGQLESQPHNQVHNLVGGYVPDAGANGAMTDVNKAANDPIFWFHHSNIDRLWAYWISLQGGRTDPTADADWMTKKFTFSDDSGKPVQMAAKDILDTSAIGYTYDSLDPMGPGETPTPPPKPKPVPPITSCTSAPVQKVLAQSAADEAPALSLIKGRVGVSLNPEQKPMLGAEAAGPVMVVLHGVKLKMQSTIVAVYVNLPEGEKASVEGPYFAGAVSVFGIGRSQHVMEFDQSFDITELLQKQQQAGLYKGGPVTVHLAGNVPEGIIVQKIMLKQ